MTWKLRKNHLAGTDGKPLCGKGSEVDGGKPVTCDACRRCGVRFIRQVTGQKIPYSRYFPRSGRNRQL